MEKTEIKSYEKFERLVKEKSEKAAKNFAKMFGSDAGRVRVIEGTIESVIGDGLVVNAFRLKVKKISPPGGWRVGGIPNFKKIFVEQAGSAYEIPRTRAEIGDKVEIVGINRYKKITDEVEPKFDLAVYFNKICNIGYNFHLGEENLEKLAQTNPTISREEEF